MTSILYHRLEGLRRAFSAFLRVTARAEMYFPFLEPRMIIIGVIGKLHSCLHVIYLTSLDPLVGITRRTLTPRDGSIHFIPSLLVFPATIFCPFPPSTTATP